jgi:hypothetical protein
MSQHEWDQINYEWEQADFKQMIDDYEAADQAELAEFMGDDWGQA